MTYSAFSSCFLFTRLVRSAGSQLRLLLALAFVIAATALNVAQAQEAYPIGFESSVVYQGLSSPAGIAVDTLGNVYIADYANNRVLLETFVSNGVYSQTTIGTGLSAPQGVAVDASFNVYIADSSNHQVLKETYASPGVYSQSTIMSSGNAYITNPTGIAVDINGNVYVSDPNTANILKLAAGTYTGTVIANYGTGLNAPYGIAVDTNLNVFIADLSSGLVELPVTCSVPVSASCAAASSMNTSSGVTASSIRGKGVAVDAHNNVYAGVGSGIIYQETLLWNGAYSQTTISATNLVSVDALAVDNRSNIYASIPATNQVIKISPYDGNFGQVNIGATSPTLTLTFDFLVGGTLTTIEAVQKGSTLAAYDDFKVVSGGTCAPGTYSAGATCTVNVQFSPLYAGTRYGAVEFINNYGELFATAYVYGTGVGPQVVFLPGVQNSIGNGIGDSVTLAVDGSGNVFVADQTNPSSSTAPSYLYEYTAASGYNTSLQLLENSGRFTDVATDGPGNIYVTNWDLGVCYKLFAADNYSTLISIPIAAAEPTGTAVDGDGNIYISSQGNGDVTEITAVSDYTQNILLYPGATGIADLAVDGSGDVFLLDFQTGTVSELVAVNGAVPANPTPVTVITGIVVNSYYGGESIKVDNVGNIYVADWTGNSVTEYFVSTNFTTSRVILNFTAATDMALDGQGNLWATSGTLGYIAELSTSAAPSLIFDATVVGQTSADSPQTVYVENIGNEPLVFPDTNPPDPSISTGFTWNSTGSGDCPVATTSNQSLGENAICAFPISFTPQSVGDVSGQLIMTDNALYTNNAQQIINLNGTGTGATMTVTADSYTIPFGSADPTYGYTTSGSLGNTSCTGAPVLTTTPANPTAIGTYTISIAKGTFTCESQYSNYVFVPGTLTITKANTQLTLTTTNATMVYGNPVPSLVNNYTLAGWTNGDSQANNCTGAPVISTLATSSSPVGTYTISADIGSLVCSDSSTNYTIKVVNAGILTITKATPTITWSPVPTTITYGTALVAGQLDAQAWVDSGLTNVSADGTFVYKYGATVITAGYVLPTGSDSICVVFTPASAYTADMNSSASTCTTITVSKASATLTLTTTNGTGVFGSTPVVTTDYTLTGFKGTDTQANSCTGSPAITTTATNTSPVSPPTYPISGAIGSLVCASTNYTYTVTFVNTGVYTVTKYSGALTLTTTNGTGAYGTTPNVASDYTLTGFVGGQTQASVCTGSPTVTTTATNTSPVGTYPISAVVNTLTCSNANATYTITIVNSGIYTVTKATGTLTLTTTNGTGVFGSTPVVSSDYTLTGFLGNDTQATVCTGSPAITTTATNTSPVSPPTYPIKGAIGSLVCSSSNATYTVNFVNNGAYTVTKYSGALTLTTTNGTGAYGATPNVAADYSLTGFVGGQTQASVCTGSPTVTTTATNTSPVGTYPISAVVNTLTCGNANASYTITIVNTGIYTVTKATATLTLTTTNGTGVFGSTPVVSSDYTLTGFLGSDTQATVCTGAPAITTTATNTSPVSPPTYTISGAIGTLVCSNSNATYTVNFVNNGKYTVTKYSGALTLTTTNGTGAYGTTPNVSADYSLTGFVGGQTQASVCTGSPTVTTTATNTSPVGTYPISAVVNTLTCSNANATYTITIVNTGIYTVTKATGVVLTLTTTNGTGVYGSTPVVSSDYTLTGFVGSDTQGTVCTGAPAITTTATNTSPVSPPTYTISGAIGSLVCSSSNATYTVNFVNNGKYTVTKYTGALTLTTTNGTGAYGTTPNVASDYSLTGFVGSDTQASVCTGSPTVTTTATNTSPVGTYPISAVVNTLTCTSANATYTITIVNSGQYTVTKASGTLTLTTTNGTGAYGTTPVVSSDYTLTGFIGSDTQGTVCTGAPVISTTATNTSPVSPPTYPISGAIGTLVCNSANASYTVTIVNSGVYTVTKASGTLTLTTTNGTGPYGTTPVVATDYTLTGFLGSDTQGTVCTGAPVISTTATNTSPASPPTYPISGAIGTLVCNSANASYTVTIVNSGQYTVTKASGVLTLTTTSVSVPYLANIPSVANDYTLTGFLGSDTQGTVCTGAPSLSTTATNTSPVGPYPITAVINTLSCSSANATYTVTIVNTGNVNITQASTTITWVPASIAYGQALTAAQLDAQAFINSGANNVSADGTFAYTYLGNPITIGSTLPYGTDNICVTFTPSAGYAADITTASLCVNISVTSAPLTITATPTATAVYNTPLPNASFTYTLSGFLGNDGGDGFGGSNNVCSGAPTLSTPAVQGSDVGIYTINVSTAGFSCTGYTFVINTGELHITPAVLTITPATTSVVYDSQVAPYTYNCYFGATYLGTGSCGGGAYVISGTPTITSTAVTRASKTPGVSYYTSNVGQYSLKTALGSLQAPVQLPPTGQGYANYTFAFSTVANALTITTSPTSLTVQPNNITTTSTACNASGLPALTYKITGLLNWDTQTSTTNGTPSLSLVGYNNDCAKGTYTIDSSSGGSFQLDTYPPFGTDYAGIDYATGTLTIN